MVATKSSHSLRNIVCDYISERITNGELLPGDSIRETDICTKFSISRTPVREAMIQLCSARLLTAVPRKGFVVRAMGRKEKQDVYDLIAVLDAQAAVSALPHIIAEDLEAMREMADFIDVAVNHRNYASYCRLQQSFHEIYRRKCDNALLLQMFHDLSVSFVVPTYLSSDKEALFAVYAVMNEEHRQIIRLFEQKDGDALFRFLAGTHWKTRYEDMI